MIKKEKAAGIAALASAGLASVCCLGPLVLTGLGLGGLGLAARLARYRPYFLGLTGAVLAFGFYRTYRKREVDCADGRCELRSTNRAARVALWATTALAVALATFPSWSGRLHCGARAATVPPGAQVLAFKVDGMDCAACTAAIARSVEKVPGVLSAEVDFAAGRARVVSDGHADARAVIAAVAAAGFKAEALAGGGDGKPRS